MNNILFRDIDNDTFCFSERLQKRRKELGYKSQRAFADQYYKLFQNEKDIYPSIQAWEQGKALPSIEKLKNLCKLLNCSSDYLLGIQLHPNSIGLSDESIQTLKDLQAEKPKLSEFLNDFINDVSFEFILKAMRKYINTNFDVKHDVSTNDGFNFMITGDTLKFQILNTINILLAQMKATRSEDADAPYDDIEG